MIIYAGKDYKDVSRKAANIMSAQIIMKPDAVLGLATGSTPVGMFAQLVEWYKKGDLDFSSALILRSVYPEAPWPYGYPFSVPHRRSHAQW